MKPYYEEPGITIYHGDCREILPMLPKVDLVLTDPPYGINLGNHLGARDNRTDHVLIKGSYASYEDSLENLRNIVIPAVEMAINGATRGIVFCAGQHIGEYPKAASVGGFFFPAAQGRNCWGFNSCATALLYGPGCRVELGSKATMISVTEASPKNGHPCPKPLRAIQHFVDLGSEPGNLILDPFMGSGTTLVAAKRLGRRAIGIEIEEKYCEIAARRLENDMPLLSAVSEPQMQDGLLFQTPEERSMRD
jgi:site-specific DNA-methyltransferase (adenine-specific)